MKDKDSHPQKITGKITVLYTWSFYFGAENWKTNDSALNDKKHSLTSIPCPLYKTINKTCAEIEV